MLLYFQPSRPVVYTVPPLTHHIVKHPTILDKITVSPEWRLLPEIKTLLERNTTEDIAEYLLYR